jgi:hypothetical protein
MKLSFVGYIYLLVSGVQAFQSITSSPYRAHHFVSITTAASPSKIHRRQQSSPIFPALKKNTGIPLFMVGYNNGLLMVEKLPSPSIINAVEANPTTTVTDVAAAAGVSLSQAKRDLTTLAAISRADLAVTEDGELLYKFPQNLNAVLAQNSAKFKALKVWRQVWPAVFWLVRVSFGLALFASLVAIFSTIFFLQTSSSSDDDRRRDDRGFGSGGGGLSWYWGPSPFDFLYYRPYGAYGYYDRDPEEMGFLESVFSYVFGDGDPNAKLDEKRLQLAANMIRSQKGAVTAEQLAPFCDDAPDPSSSVSSSYVDESFVLPIVSALNGEPVVTEEGDIVYVFPELQTTAGGVDGSATTALTPRLSQEAMVLKRAGMTPNASSREIAKVLNFNGISTRGAVERKDLIELLERALPPMTPAEEAEFLDSDPSVLQEREWKFSLANDLNKFLAGGLGVVNLGGAVWLGTLLSQYASYGRLPGYLGTMQALYPVLLVYAVLFNAIPAARNFWIQNQNAKIQRRNERRKSWQMALTNAIQSNDRISKKLRAAKKMKMKVKKIDSQKDIVYDTSRPMEENALKREQKSLEEFDRLLENDEEKSFQ